jgi:hypothetical protein
MNTKTSNQDRLSRIRFQKSLGAVCGALLLLALASGCSDSGPAGPDVNLSFSYLPGDSELELGISQNQFFKVEVSPEASFSVDWYAGGELLSEGRNFTYFPSHLGVDTLRAEVTSDGTRDQREWIIRVVSSIDDRPPEVTPIYLEDGALPGEVTARWLEVAESSFAIEEYVVAISYDGPINVNNWDSVVIKDTVPDDGSLQFQRTYPLTYGVNVWFAVRARDVTGQLSAITRGYGHSVTYPWSLSLTVLDDELAPAPQVILKWIANGVESSGNTPASGFLEIGPFRNIDSISLETQINNGSEIGDFYDFVDPEISVTDGTDLTITLMGRFGMDTGCLAGFNGDFLKYFRYMTSTDRESTLRPNYFLLKWESFPVRVYVPEFVDEFGMDLAAVVADGVAGWNNVMGEAYFELVDRIAEADIYFEFPDLPNQIGLVTLMEPSDEDYSIGSVIPEKMRVEIDSGTDRVRRVAVMVVMHELGHTLGIARHVPCQDPPYLMYISVATDLDDEHGGIHPDEQNMARMLRYLPQAMDMSLFVLD